MKASFVVTDRLIFFLMKVFGQMALGCFLLVLISASDAGFLMSTVN